MKPCRKYRKQIAWLAMESLEAQREPELRAHLDECANCQKYFVETQSIAKKLSGAKPEPSVESSPSFHRRVAEVVAGAKRHSTIESFFAELVFHWIRHLALPAIASAAVAIVVWVITPQRSEVGNPSPAVIIKRATPEIESSLAPTVSNYELAARQSLDKLDELLTEQGGRNSSSTPAFTAGQHSLSDIVN